MKRIRTVVPILLLMASPSLLAGDAEKSIEKGEALLRNQRFDAASRFFERFVAESKENPVGYYYLGRIALRQGRLERARGMMEKAVALAPSNSLYRLWLGRAFGYQARDSKNIFQQYVLARHVRSELETAVELDPANLEARESLIDYYALAPMLLGGGPEKAQRQVEAISRIDPRRGELAWARLYRAQKNDRAAERRLLELTSRAPNAVEPMLALARLYQETGRFEKAFSVLEDLLTRRPGALEACYEVGRTSLLSGLRFDRGRACLERYLESRPVGDEPTLADAHVTLGDLLLRIGRDEEAKREYREALRLEPQRPAVQEALARVE